MNASRSSTHLLGYHTIQWQDAFSNSESQRFSSGLVFIHLEVAVVIYTERLAVVGVATVVALVSLLSLPGTVLIAFLPLYFI
jgi:hypothetical protein